MKMNLSNQDFYVLIVDDDDAIRNGLKKLYSGKYKIDTASGVEEAEKLLSEKSIGIAIVDYEMPNKNGLELMEIICSKYPGIRRIMLTGLKDLELAKKAINEGRVHNFINKPINQNELISILKNQAENYSKWQIDENQKMIDKIDAKTYRKELSLRNKQLLDTLINFENVEMNLLAKQIGDVINEYFVELKNLLIDQRKENENRIDSNFTKIKHLLRDCELLAEKFNLFKVQLLTQLLLMNIFLLFGNLTDAYTKYKRSQELLQEIENADELSMFTGFIHDTVLFSKNPNIVKEQYQDDFYHDIENLLNLDVFQLSQFGSDQWIFRQNLPVLSYLIITRDQLPIYTSIFSPRKIIDPNLISNFVIALSMFALDVFSEDGSINVVSHDLGVILINQMNDNITYIVIASTETIGLRVSLQEFANETIPYIMKLSPNVKINENDDFMKNKLNKYFSNRN